MDGQNGRTWGWGARELGRRRKGDQQRNIPSPCVPSHPPRRYAGWRACSMAGSDQESPLKLLLTVETSFFLVCSARFPSALVL